MNINYYYSNLLQKYILIDYMYWLVTALLLKAYNYTYADRKDIIFILSFAFETEGNAHSSFLNCPIWLSEWTSPNKHVLW